jgi:serine/threonine-protein kinase
MELLEGETLAQRVKRDGALPPTEATFIALQAARALAEAHRKGIVHRDVKPENLFLASVGEPRALLKVLDFGVAKVLREGGDEAERSITREGALLGTPMFMAPEQGLGEEADARADVYALGCVLYFCLCGAAPFADGPAATIILSHVAKPVPDLRARCPHALSDALVATVARCLEKRPALRYADAGALADALAALPA